MRTRKDGGVCHAEAAFVRHRVGGRLPLDFVFAREATPTPDEQLVRLVSGSGLCVPGSFTVCFAAHV